MPSDPAIDSLAEILQNSRASAVTVIFHHKIRTLSIAIMDGQFTGEFIDPPRIQWLSAWFPLQHLGTALRAWKVPVDHQQGLTVRAGAQFIRAADIGMFSDGFDQEKASKLVNLVIPNTPTDPFLNIYSGENCVYFVQAKQLGLIKIGFSGNATQRLSALKTGCPDELVLLNVIRGDKAVEHKIHGRFENNRVRGEWFTPTPELMRFIEAAEY